MNRTVLSHFPFFLHFLHFFYTFSTLFGRSRSNSTNLPKVSRYKRGSSFLLLNLMKPFLLLALLLPSILGCNWLQCGIAAVQCADACIESSSQACVACLGPLAAQCQSCFSKQVQIDVAPAFAKCMNATAQQVPNLILPLLLLTFHIGLQNPQFGGAYSTCAIVLQCLLLWQRSWVWLRVWQWIGRWLLLQINKLQCSPLKSVQREVVVTSLVMSPTLTLKYNSREGFMTFLLNRNPPSESYPMLVIADLNRYQWSFSSPLLHFFLHFFEYREATRLI